MGQLTMELYLKNLSLRYRQATKKEKGKMLDEHCATSGHSRKHAIKVINNYKKRRTMPVTQQSPRPLRKEKQYPLSCLSYNHLLE